VPSGAAITLYIGNELVEEVRLSEKERKKERKKGRKKDRKKERKTERK
jgi:hypothetical protein